MVDKKPYTRPSLVVHGNVEVITKGVLGGADDAPVMGGLGLPS